MSLIIFDIDGTLIDSRDAYSDIFHEVFLKYGKYISTEEIRKGIIPSIPLNILKYFEKSKLSVIEKEVEILMGMKGIEKTKLCEGIKELDKLSRDNILVAITNSNQEFVDAFTKKFKLDKYFKEIISAHSVYNADKVVAIKDIMKKYKKDVLYIGDTIKDIEIARKVGCKVCILYTKCSWDYNNLNEIKKAKPDFIINSLGEIKNVLNK